MSDEIWVNDYTLGMTSTNCYLLSGTYLIDPGGMNDDLRSDLDSYGDDLEAILLTHAHYDHIAGIGQVREVVGDCPVWCHGNDVEMLGNPEKNMSLWTDSRTAFEADQTFDGMDSLTVRGQSIDVLHTPGHTRGSVSFYIESEQLLFAGDTLFQQGIGRTDLPGGDHQQLLQSIRQEILSLPRGTRILPGHGPETTVGEESHNNPYLN